MENERRIGRVVSVDSERVLVELDEERKSLTRTFLTGTYPVARINSYVVIPIGSVSVVGIVTRVSMRGQDLELRDRSALMLAEPRRTIDVTMVGTVTKTKGKLEFSYGIKDFPALDNPVWFILEEELDIIFDKHANDKYFVELGASAAYPEYKAKLNPDVLFSRHLAVIGNTGGGKSCTIASLIQTILRDEAVKKGAGAHFVIFDTNGEYKEAFSSLVGDAEQTEEFATLHIDQDGLRIPYWFMNLDDFRQLFRVTEGVQEPVLSTAISLAKQESQTKRGSGKAQTEEFILQAITDDLNKLLSDVHPVKPSAEGYVGKNIMERCDSIIGLCEEYEQEASSIEQQLKLGKTVKSLAEDMKKLCPSKSGYVTMEAAAKVSIEKIARPLLDATNGLLFNLQSEIVGDRLLDASSPVHFSLKEFYERSLPMAMRIQGGRNERIKEYCSTMILRIKRLISDERYDVLFQDVEYHPHTLAAFLRLCFGRMGNAKIWDYRKGTTLEGDFFLEKYCAKCKEKHESDYSVVLFDLSLVAFDVLENVTALLGRLMLEFVQRVEKAGTYKGADVRGKFPVVLVLEEAHNYIPEKLPLDKESVSKEVFERIAREGRKYGLSLVVSSQRPSELSRTVLSQCNSFITHRIQNPEDQNYVSKLLPSVSHDLLKQLPILKQGVALVFGDCVRAPMEVEVKKPDPEPKSHDPQFWRHWTNTYADGEFSFPERGTRLRGRLCPLGRCQVEAEA